MGRIALARNDKHRMTCPIIFHDTPIFIPYFPKTLSRSTLYSQQISKEVEEALQRNFESFF